MITMTKEEQAAIESLRNRGFAVIVWYPHELRGAGRKYVEDGSVEHGYTIIDALATQPEESA